MAFEANIRRNGGVAVVELHGDIDAGADEAINTAYEEAIEGNPANVLLNFDGVSYINSTGIALVVGLLAEARKNGRNLSACGLSEHYKEIFEITRIADFVTMFSDEQTAVDGAARS
jgi:anti-sigma B factor antagonist